MKACWSCGATKRDNAVLSARPLCLNCEAVFLPSVRFDEARRAFLVAFALYIEAVPREQAAEEAGSTYHAMAGLLEVSGGAN